MLKGIYFYPPIFRGVKRSERKDGQIEGRQRGGWRVAILGGSRSFRKRKDAPPMARSDINKEPSGNKSSVSPKVAATSSPTTQCSTIGDAELNDPVSLPLSLSLPCALCPRPSLLRCSPLSPAPARRSRAHRRPPRASDAFFSTQRPPLTHDYIKSMGSLSIRCSLWSRSLSIYRAFLIRCASHGCIYVLRTIE